MIIFTKKAYQKLKYFTLNSKQEISGLGQSQIINSNIIEIKDIEIFPQYSSFGSTKLDEEHLAKFLYEKTLKNEDVSEYNVWFHSHGSMSVFWSGVDENTIETTTSNAYLISIVINRKLEILGRLDIFKPFRYAIPLKIIVPKIKHNKKLERYCINKIKSCVKTYHIQKTNTRRLEKLLEELKKEIPGVQISSSISISKGKKVFLIPSDSKRQLQ